VARKTLLEFHGKIPDAEKFQEQLMQGAPEFWSEVFGT
jgi:hypothetical protein